MTEKDELARLKDALKSSEPRPDPDARARALDLAMQCFDAENKNSTAVEKQAETDQETESPPRPNQDRPQRAGILLGVRAMFERLNSKVALMGTASVAVTAMGLFLIIGPQLNGPNRPSQIVVPEMVPTGITPMEQDSMAEVSPPYIAQPGPSALISAQPRQAQTPPPLEFANHAAKAVPSAGAGGAMLMRHAANSQIAATPMANADRFAPFDPNPLKVSADDPVSTFSIDVDTASWSWVRQALRMGQMPDPASVRIEEMVNYFPYSYPVPLAGNPATDAPFATEVAVFQTPWNKGTQLVRIGLQGQLPEIQNRPPLNLVFLVDTSGSMQGPDRLGLLKTSFGMLLDSLRPEDRVAIVAYAGSAGEVLAPTSATDRRSIMAALDGLMASGGTAGGEGLELAYDLAAKMAAESDGKDSVNRVILATDGDFNLGLSSPDELKTFVETKRRSGTFLSVLGFGRGNLDDALMQALAQNGNGQAAYIDSAEEARKVLVDQAAGALFPIAGDVKIQVEWNPAIVAEYRLIGYETRALAREDFSNDKVDAGDIGAGHQVTAIYEITPVDSAARLTEPLRYEVKSAAPTMAPTEAGWLRLRYKRPGQNESALIETAIPATVSPPDSDAGFAAAIAGFGQLLSGGKYLGDWGYDDAIALAASSKGDDPFGYRAEAVSLMRTAQSLAGQDR